MVLHTTPFPSQLSADALPMQHASPWCWVCLVKSLISVLHHTGKFLDI